MMNICDTDEEWINLLRLGGTFIYHWAGSSLVQVMGCLFDTKPLPEPTMINCKLDNWGQNSVKFESYCHDFHAETVFKSNVCRMVAMLPWPQCVNTMTCLGMRCSSWTRGSPPGCHPLGHEFKWGFISLSWGVPSNVYPHQVQSSLQPSKFHFCPRISALSPVMLKRNL